MFDGSLPTRTKIRCSMVNLVAQRITKAYKGIQRQHGFWSDTDLSLYYNWPINQAILCCTALLLQSMESRAGLMNVHRIFKHFHNTDI